MGNGVCRPFCPTVAEGGPDLMTPVRIQLSPTHMYFDWMEPFDISVTGYPGIASDAHDSMLKLQARSLGHCFGTQGPR